MPSAITPIRFQDLDALELRTARGGRAVVALHGGQVLSWTPPGGSERI